MSSIFLENMDFLFKIEHAMYNITGRRLTTELDISCRLADTVLAFHVHTRLLNRHIHIF